MPFYAKGAAGVSITDSGTDAGPYSNNDDTYTLVKTYTIDNSDNKLLDIWFTCKGLASSSATNKGVQININEVAFAQLTNWPAGATRVFWHICDGSPGWAGSPPYLAYSSLAQFPVGNVTVKIYVKGSAGATTISDLQLLYAKRP